MITPGAARRRRRRPLPTVEAVSFVPATSAEQRRRRDDAIAVLMELGRRHLLRHAAPDTPAQGVV